MARPAQAIFEARWTQVGTFADGDQRRLGSIHQIIHGPCRDLPQGTPKRPLVRGVWLAR